MTARALSLSALPLALVPSLSLSLSEPTLWTLGGLAVGAGAVGVIIRELVVQARRVTWVKVGRALVRLARLALWWVGFFFLSLGIFGLVLLAFNNWDRLLGLWGYLSSSPTVLFILYLFVFFYIQERTEVSRFKSYQDQKAKEAIYAARKAQIDADRDADHVKTLREFRIELGITETDPGYLEWICQERVAEAQAARSRRLAYELNQDLNPEPLTFPQPTVRS